MGGVEKSGAQGKMHMKRLGWLIWLGVAAFLCVPPSFAAGDADEAGDGPGEAVVLGEEDFAERLEILRNQFRRMTPGDGELVQDAGAWPAAWEEFSPRWDTAPATRDLATWVVPIVAERESGATVLRDGNGAELWRGTTDFAKETSTNVTLTGALVDESDWPLYMAAKEELAWRRAAEACRQESGELRGYTNGPCTTGLHFVSAVGNFATSPPELHVGLAWTNNGTVDVFAYGPLHVAVTNEVTWTNDENVVETTNVVSWHAAEPTLTGFGNTWKWVGSLAVSNTGTNVFIDHSFPTNRGIVRYYAAAEAVDSDGDGLNDGFETFVFHSDPELGDSDGDGIGDGAEAAMGFDPADAGDCPMVMINAVLYNPDGDDSGWEWVELYSAGARAADLSGFRLEVGRSFGWDGVLEFSPGTSIEPGRCLLVGESFVTNADVSATLNIPNRNSSGWPTGVRLVWSGATNGSVVDVVMLGGNTNFNLDTTGWLSAASIEAYSGNAAVRCHTGWDTDRAEDWTWASGRTGQGAGIDIDSDGDGLNDAVERTGTANTNALWFGEPTDPWNADSDGDGLGDYDECVVHGTNPNAWASDGDIWPWMPEGTMASNWPGSDSFEVASGYWNPLVKDQNENGFPDSWEMVLGLSALQNGGDSDGDGVDDVTEIQQNSNPQNAADSTPKPYVVRYESSMPGWRNGGGMNDVGWRGWVDIHFMGASLGTCLLAVVQEGSTPEEFTANWTGIGENNIAFSADGQSCFGWAIAGMSPCLRIADLGLHPNYVNALGGEFTVERPFVRLATMKETANPVNRIFNPTPKDDATSNTSVLEQEGDATYAVPRNHLYMIGHPGDGRFEVSLSLDIASSGCDGNYVCAAYHNEAKVQGSDAVFAENAPMPITLHVPAQEEEVACFEVKMGYDIDGNQLLDAEEAFPLEVYRSSTENTPRYAVIHGISSGKYTQHFQEIHDRVHFLGQNQPDWPCLHARSFLALFHYNGDMSHIKLAARPSDVTSKTLDPFAEGVGFSEWLTHNSGADFGGNEQATVLQYIWDPETEVSEFVSERTPFALKSTFSSLTGYFEIATETGNQLKTFYDTVVKPLADEDLANDPVGTTKEYPSSTGWYAMPCASAPNLFLSSSPQRSSTWVEPATVIIGEDDDYSGYGALFSDLLAGSSSFQDFDAFGTIGRGRVRNPRYRFTVQKESSWFSTENVVSEVRFVCDIEDLYDFNYEDSVLTSHAAALQIGYGNGNGGGGRNGHGKIYRVKIMVDKTYYDPFRYQAIQYPVLTGGWR